MNNLDKKHALYKLNAVIVDGKPYNSETGEFIGDKFDVKITDKLSNARKKAMDKRQQEQSYLDAHEKANGGFVWCLFNSVDRFPSLNGKDIARLLYLATYVCYEDGILQKGNGTKITTDNVHELIKMNKRRAKGYLDKLVAEGIIEILDKYIKINPHAFYKGSIDKIEHLTKDLKYIRLFRKSVRNIFENAKENELMHIATIYSILPFLNREYNYICHNVDEKVADDIVFMDTKELSKVAKLGSYNKMMEKLRKVTVDGMPVFTFIEDVYDRRKKNIIVNHNVIYAGRNVEHMKALDAIFKPKKARKPRKPKAN